MKYNIIASLFVFLFLAYNPDFNTNQKNIKYQSSKKRVKFNKKGLKPKTKTSLNQKEVLNQEANYKKEEDINKKTENALLNDLRNLI
ncbi:hypothetical protein QIA37_04980 (plasmid) [Borrelia sp. CA_690]|uniref:hypothetical protein n=1 Tax=Borrelia TaxID=138 RepID=UPI001E3AEB5C|nr:hypothetical protein [Borrelia maritima]